MSQNAPPVLDSTAAALSPDGLIDTFMDALWLEDGLAANTLAAYRRDLSLLSQWLRAQGLAKTLAQVSETDLRAYLLARHALSKATTANRRLAVFRRFYRWALRETWVSSDPTLKLTAIRN
ncbi:MAG: site-specific integrase, partial [Ideonella sp.]|nr:site-specific integrase [Ideonella sp.]